MDGKIENILKDGEDSGDKEKVLKVLNGLRLILKETQKDNQSLCHQNDISDKTTIQSDTGNTNICNIVKNNTNILVDDNTTSSIQNHNRTDFYNENTTSNNNNHAKLKDIAETYQGETNDLDHNNDNNNNNNRTENIQTNTIEENNSENSRLEESFSSLSSSSSTSFNDLNFGINELLLIVEEYEGLKEKYLRLETSVESQLKSSSRDQASNELSLEKIEELQKENKRLTDEIGALTQQNEQNVKLQEALQKTIERLEVDVAEQKKEVATVTERLSAHDVAAKRAITVLQKEMGARVDQVTKMYENSVSEKDGYIVKISKLESTIQDMKQSQTTFQKKKAEKDTELDHLKGLLKVKETEHAKIVSLNEQFEKDISKLNKRVESHKEEMEGQEIKVKWSQNKLKTELEAHKETKKQLSTLTHKLQEAKEEGEQIRRNTQEMIARYQGDEEINSVSLRKQLEEEVKSKKDLENLYNTQNNEFKEQANQMRLLKEKQHALVEQLEDQKAIGTALEGKNAALSKQLLEKKEDCAEMKTQIDELKTQIKELQEYESKSKEYELVIAELREKVDGLTNQLNDYVSEVKEHQEKEKEILLYSQNLTENNVLSKASLNELQTKLEQALREKTEVSSHFKAQEDGFLKKIEVLTNDKMTLQEKVGDMMGQLETKSMIVNEISSELEETKNELKVMKKKNASQMKDLQRELQQTTRKLEQLECGSTGNGSVESLSTRSRTSSCNSLEKLQAVDSPVYSASPNASSSPQLPHEGVVIPQDHYVTQPNRPAARNNNNGELEIDKRMLVERICKLQKIHAKKNEKIEFLEDHNMQLTEALQKKSKILQHYFSRKEAGIIAPDAFDNNKAAMSQHGGIMSSVYSAKATDKGLTLELSLAINHKLQAVLEDTVLKNITLQDSINTLGMEIAKLQEGNKSNT